MGRVFVSNLRLLGCFLLVYFGGVVLLVVLVVLVLVRLKETHNFYNLPLPIQVFGKNLKPFIGKNYPKNHLIFQKEGDSYMENSANCFFATFLRG